MNLGLFRRILPLFCVIVLVLSLALPVRAAADNEGRDLVQQMLNYYRYHETRAETDIYRLLEDLDSVDPQEAAFWRSIFDHWFFAANEMPKNDTVLPDDLPQDDSLCILVLGYRLQDNGAIEQELIGRLELALAAAQKYPNAIILCTGGGTAADAPNTTEAYQMARWLKKQGVDSNRIVTERASAHTIHNAQYSFRILARDYPQVTSIALITSDYHLLRSSTLLFAQSLLTAAKNETPPVRVAAYLGYEAGHEGFSEDPLDQVAHVARLCGFEYRYEDEPVLSQLTELMVDAPAELDSGSELPLTVIAAYDSGYSRDVTMICDISGYDPAVADTQSVTVSYEENGILLQSVFEITRPLPETEPPTEAPTEPSIPQTELPATKPQKTPGPTQLIPVFFVLIGILTILLFLRKKQ